MLRTLPLYFFCSLILCPILLLASSRDLQSNSFFFEGKQSIRSHSTSSSSPSSSFASSLSNPPHQSSFPTNCSVILPPSSFLQASSQWWDGNSAPDSFLFHVFFLDSGVGSNAIRLRGDMMSSLIDSVGRTLDRSQTLNIDIKSGSGNRIKKRFVSSSLMFVEDFLKLDSDPFANSSSGIEKGNKIYFCVVVKYIFGADAVAKKCHSIGGTFVLDLIDQQKQWPSVQSLIRSSLWESTGISSHEFASGFNFDWKSLPIYVIQTDRQAEILRNLGAKRVTVHPHGHSNYFGPGRQLIHKCRRNSEISVSSPFLIGFVGHYDHFLMDEVTRAIVLFANSSSTADFPVIYHQYLLSERFLWLQNATAANYFDQHRHQQLLNSADVAVVWMPDYSEFTMTYRPPTRLVTWFSHSIPVVYQRVPAYTDVIRRNCMKIAPMFACNYTNDLIRSLKTLKDNDQLRCEYAEEAFQASEYYNPKNWALTFIESLCEGLGK